MTTPARDAARGHEFEGRGPRCLKCGDSRWSHEHPEHPAANVYLVKTKDQRTYTEPIMDDGSGPSFYCWPMAPVVAETPGKAKKLFLDAFAQGARTGVETDDYPNLRVTTLAKGVERPVGVYADDDELWKLVSHA